MSPASTKGYLMAAVIHALSARVMIGSSPLRTSSESGGVMCRHCFEKGNGDGFSAIQWASGCDFPEALRRVSDYLQLQPFETVAGRANNTGRGQQQLGTWGTRDPAKHSYQGYGTLDEAIASALRGIRRRHPRAIETGRWHYQSNGEAFGTAVRFDTGDLDEATAKPKKEFRPIRRTPNGKWAIGKGDETVAALWRRKVANRWSRGRK